MKLSANKTNASTATAIALAMTTILGSCVAEPVGIDKNEEYTREFVKAFGAFDYANDWNAATRCSASITGRVPARTAAVRIYTEQPGTPGAMLAAEYPATAASMSFDLAKASDYAYVELVDAEGLPLYAAKAGIRDGVLALNVDDAVAACPTTIGDGIRPNNVVTADIRNFPEEVLPTWKNLLGEERYNRAMLPNTDPDYEIVKATEVFKTYTLDNKQTTKGTPQPFRYVAGIVGRQGRFLETVCNVSKFRDELHPEHGVEYTMAEDGPVTLTYFWGGTMFFNKLGYFYYREGATVEEIMRAPRFIIIDDAQPHRNIFRGDSPTEPGSIEFSGGMVPPTALDFYENGNEWAQANAYVTGTQHRLVFYGFEREFEKGAQGSYTFPAGTHIGFFIVKNVGENSEENDIPWRRSYSLPQLNKLMNYTTSHSGGCKNNNVTGESIPEEMHGTFPNEDFVTYRWHGYTLMGIEDGTDHDANDMMFFVNANIKPDEIVEMGDPDPEPQSWILAIEDLGSTDDFDFNDVVVKVSHTANSGKLIIEPLAAGGTLPTRLYFRDDAEDLGFLKGYMHFNDFFGEQDYTVMINTRSITHTGEVFEIDVPADFTMSSDPLQVEGNRMGGFYVRVKQEGDAGGNWTQGVVDIQPARAGSVPQILCVPGTWQWPKERVNISDAYPKIKEWIKDRNVNADWYEYPVEDKVIKR